MYINILVLIQHILVDRFIIYETPNSTWPDLTNDGIRGQCYTEWLATKLRIRPNKVQLFVDDFQKKKKSKFSTKMRTFKDKRTVINLRGKICTIIIRDKPLRAIFTLERYNLALLCVASAFSSVEPTSNSNAPSNPGFACWFEYCQAVRKFTCIHGGRTKYVH